LEEANMSISMLLDIAVEQYGDRTALGGVDSGISYRAMDRLSKAGAADLHADESRSLVFVGVNGTTVPLLLFSAARAGVPFVPLNYRLSSGALCDLLGELDRPRVIADESFAPALTAGLGGTVRVTTSTEWLANCEERAALAAWEPPVDASPTAIVLFTSGTTAKPKGVLLRHENLISYILGTVELGGAAPRECNLVSVPPYHVAGMGGALSNIYAGRRMAYLPDFEPRRWLESVVRENVSHAMLVPTMLARIVEENRNRPVPLPSLKSIAYGGAKVRDRVLVEALRMLPDVDFTNAYGLTETSSTIALLSPQDHREALNSDDPGVRARLRSTGRPVPGIEVQVRGPDGGPPLPAGVTGELWIRGDQVSGEYDGAGSVLDGDGWFPTRDRVKIDADGYLFIEGRADDTIIRGGENIYPTEIEQVLLQHPAVADVCVFGLPDEEWGERIAAVVVPAAASPDPEDVRAFARARLRGSRTPDIVIVRSQLPYGPAGKIIRRDLVREILSAAGQAEEVSV
jgi:acyl-CoA synthetase (AMP-forming)/AMP-acid ligase II